jgi:KUP system potassium uptake protein
VLLPFLAVDVMFLAANIPKIPQGGWFPLVVGAGLALQMTTWRRGRQLVARRIARGDRSMADALADALDSDVARVPGTAVYLFKDVGAAAPAFVANVRHNHVLHETVLLVSVDVADQPHVAVDKRARTTLLGGGVTQVRVVVGFMDEPDVPAILRRVKLTDGSFDPDTATYFLGRESVTSGKAPGMHPLREELFVLLNRGAANAARFFQLPPDQVMEVGTQVEI